MRRFELSEGSSNKFWEIAGEGAGYTVRYGKIGTATEGNMLKGPRQEERFAYR